MRTTQSDARQRVKEIIDLGIDLALKNVKDGKYLDPVVRDEVQSHYGHIHISYSLLFSGVHFGNQEHEKLGKLILSRVVDNWDSWSRKKDFHHDFNNFGLSICLEFLDNSSRLYKAIVFILQKSVDSNHNTINWLPMRIYSNIRRDLISPNAQYRRANKSLLNTVISAMNSDGGIEDLIPNNLSYNLQYNISTLALLQFLNINTTFEIDLSRELAFVLSKKLPDNDINYMGRGSNQLFGWGPWLYLLSSSYQYDFLDEALDFVKRYLSSVDSIDSVLLNSKNASRNLHWDYHYSSVYLSHLILWSCLAYRDMGKSRLSLSFEDINRETTGLKKVVNEGSGYVTFSGRSKYLSEQGPSICALFFADLGVFFKGSSGPWPGQFGDKNFSPVNHYLHFGVLEISTGVFYHNRVFKKLVSFIKEDFSYKIKPLFLLSKIEVLNSKALEINFSLKFRRGSDYLLNVPVFERLDEFLQLEVNVSGKTLSVCSEVILSNQYENLKIRQYKLIESSNLKLRISRA